jgi:hypothetical protein
MQPRTRQCRHGRVGGDEGVRTFEHRLLQHGTYRRIVSAKQGAQMPPEPFMCKSRLRNHSLGAPPFYFVENLKRCHVRLNRRI